MASSSTTTALRKAAVLLAGGGVFAATGYLSYHWQKMEDFLKQNEKKRNGEELSPNFSYVNNPCRNDQYRTVASCYDDAIGTDELYMGINLLRRLLLHFNARGTVLEVGAGTARNLPYYPSAVTRVVLVDTSDEMLEQARQKIAVLQKKNAAKANAKANANLREQLPQFVVSHADSAHLNLPSDAFDTVVDTFGLCSYDDPLAVLTEMARVCKKTDDSRILLLEHGRSPTWSFVTRHLDRHAEQHAAHWGCVWNRDLDAILAAAVDNNVLQIETVRKFHFGTTYYVVARPKQHHQHPAAVAATASDPK